MKDVRTIWGQFDLDNSFPYEKGIFVESVSVFTSQGSKLTLANSQNASAFDNLRVRKIATSKRLRVRIIHVYQTIGKNLLVISPVCQQKKNLTSKILQVD